MRKPIRIIFAGTPPFAVPFLNSLIDEPDFDVVAVITQPDRPVGRKQILTPSPVKELAKKNNLLVLQPINFKDKKIMLDLLDLSPDLLVVVAYGLIIPDEILNIAKKGGINVHPSLLPKHRGASPIQDTILTGDEEAGVTIMLMDKLMDHGPILTQEKIDLDGTETGQVLHDRLALIGQDLLISTIKEYLAGEVMPQEQNHESATYCQPLKKENAKINWQDEAENIERQIRAYYFWPVAWTTYKGKRLKIFPPVVIVDANKIPGQIFLADGQLAVATGNKKALIISRLQLEGKEAMSAEEFLCGNQDIVGKVLI